MKIRILRSPIATAAFVVAALSIGAPLLAQTPVRVNLPGTAAAPTVVANAWAFEPRAVGSQTVLRLKIQFPGGFDSAVNPGEFVLTGVVVDFPGKAKTLPATTTVNSGAQSQAAGSTVPPVSSKGVIYTLANNNDLVWYRHSGQQDGTFRWAAPAGKKVGAGWDFKQVFSGGNGVIYAITPGGDLLWYRHDGRGDGTFRWAASAGKKVGAGWDFKQVFSGGGGVIYAITANDDLLWYRHDGRGDGSFRWAAPQGKKVGNGWSVKDIFCDEGPGV